MDIDMQESNVAPEDNEKLLSNAETVPKPVKSKDNENIPNENNVFSVCRIALIASVIIIVIVLHTFGAFDFIIGNSGSYANNNGILTVTDPNGSDYNHIIKPSSPARYPKSYGPTPADIVRYRARINRTLTNIWNEWEIDQYPLFLSMMNIPMLSWKIQKNKFIKMIMNNHIGDKVNQLKYSRHHHNENDKLKNYVMGFSGSSVTAGHGK